MKSTTLPRVTLSIQFDAPPATNSAKPSADNRFQLRRIAMKTSMHNRSPVPTVNIRVRDLTVWNEIATAKSLTKVRELQADPEVGGKGLISQDTPTNIYFFIASWRR